MKTVYIETSIISYLTARPSKNLIAVARQQQTWEWWDIYRQNYTLFSSNLVIAEASQGDTKRSQERLDVLREIERLDINTACEELGEKLIVHSPIPDNAQDDALHIAIASYHAVDFNFKHLANAHLIPKVRTIVENSGYQFPQICTPEELIGE
ncbi:PIN domain-containing protein [Desulfonema limicola]|uniref:PIN domain-containing protein n=1 Tax=Desulfonema limicola TaxID=45656 RepID=A0A975BA21_9BACT|nr:type II toxin-antitoxin system VapC family toxin [Desulfonema limicola]QTA81320.1 PIN domain-containing protein [Desulfonema limicola]